MNINVFIDLWAISIKSNELNTEDRADTLLFLFSQLKTVDVVFSDITPEIANYIVTAISKDMSDNKLKVLHDKLLKSEVLYLAEAVLGKKKIPKHSDDIQKVPEEKYEEVDVLEVEGYLNPPPVKEMVEIGDWTERLRFKE